MAMRQMQAQPAAKPAKQPGAMLQRARSLAVGGGGQPSLRFPTKPLPAGGGAAGNDGAIGWFGPSGSGVIPPGGPQPGTAPGIASMSGVQEGQAGPPGMFNHPGQQLGTPDAMDPGTAEGIRRMGGTPPIYAGGQQPGQPPGSGLPTMDGAPGTAVPPPEGGPTPWSMNGVPDVRPTGQHPLNPAAGGGMPPGMQLPPQLQQAVQAGRLDPQQAFDRAMQNRAGFRQQVMQQQAQQPQQRGIRNLSDVFRGGGFSAAPGQMPLNTKPLPANGAGGVAQQGPLAGGGGGFRRGPFGY